MNEPLTKTELQLSIAAIDFAIERSSPSPATLAASQSVRQKLCAGVTAIEQREALAGTGVAETFPRRITAEEAQQYSETGEMLMLQASQTIRVDEATHYKLSCLVVGLTTVLVAQLKIPRDRFCNTLITNIMFSALKAAYALPQLLRERAPDVPK